MKQISFADQGFVHQHKTTRKQRFLSEMEQVVPWPQLYALIEPHYPKPGRGRRPFPLDTMLRIHFMQQWFALSDPAMEEALHDIPLMRAFARLDAGNDRMPDETTILNFRHLLERHQLAPQLLATVNALLNQQGLLLRQGTLVDATLIAAPSSTKNQQGQRDPEMSQTKKGNQWYFGVKVHIGVDMDSGLIHSVQLTTAKVADIRMTNHLQHGEEQLVIGDGGYHRKNRTLGHTHARQGVRMLTPYKRQGGQELEAGQPVPGVEAPVWLCEGALSGFDEEPGATGSVVCAGQSAPGAQASVGVNPSAEGKTCSKAGHCRAKRLVLA